MKSNSLQELTDHRQPTTDYRLVMGTRGSPLALAQSRLVAASLQAAHPGLVVEERIIRTTGDKMQGAPLPQIGGKGVFTLEIEQALLNREIDFAVHSLKDLPPQSPPGLCIGAIPKRASASDVCILNSRWREWQTSNGMADSNLIKNGPPPLMSVLSLLPEGARVGTSSLRRQAQLLHLRPDLKIENLRGNIDTRLRKLEEQNFHAIILARAGLQRLCSETPVSSYKIFDLPEREFVPAPGQGALAIEVRADDEGVLQILKALDHCHTRAEISAERAAMRTLNAGCSTPLGARAVVTAETLDVWAVILTTDGQKRLVAEAQGALEDAELLGESLAQRLLAQGAAGLLVS